MILFFAPGGRLGNLLFQFSFILGIRKPGEWVLGTQFKSFPQHFLNMRRIVSTDNQVVKNIVRYILYPLIYHFLVKTRFISSYYEKEEWIVYKKGVLPITIFGGYFQRDEVKSFNFQLKTKYTLKPLELLNHAKGKTPLFLHIRRGDYTDFRVHGVSPLLPATYYLDCLKYWDDLWASVHFFIVGDDPFFAEENFSFLPNKTISRLSPSEDLFLMTQCMGGVISNSSFAWWGAQLSGGNQPVFAPKYWLGWPVKKWYPPAVCSKRFTYIDVKE